MRVVTASAAPVAGAPIASHDPAREISRRVQEPAKPAAPAEVEPAPRKARQAPAERRGLRRHVTPRKVVAVASLVGLAYLAKGTLCS